MALWIVVTVVVQVLMSQDPSPRNIALLEPLLNRCDTTSKKSQGTYDSGCHDEFVRQMSRPANASVAIAAPPAVPTPSLQVKDWFPSLKRSARVIVPGLMGLSPRYVLDDQVQHLDVSFGKSGLDEGCKNGHGRPGRAKRHLPAGNQGLDCASNPFGLVIHKKTNRGCLM
jgi:hypothetical protein